MSEDAIAEFKNAQRQGWKHFAPLEALTTPAAARLVKFAKVRAGQNVLDVGCGTGVAAITAARVGARVRGIDLTPELLERARENARIANVESIFAKATRKRCRSMMSRLTLCSATSVTCSLLGRMLPWPKCCACSSAAAQSRLRHGRRSC